MADIKDRTYFKSIFQFILVEFPLLIMEILTRELVLPEYAVGEVDPVPSAVFNFVHNFDLSAGFKVPHDVIAFKVVVLAYLHVIDVLVVEH